MVIKVHKQRPLIYPHEDDYTSDVEGILCVIYVGSDVISSATLDALRAAKMDVELALAFAGVEPDEARQVASRIALVVSTDSGTEFVGEAELTAVLRSDSEDE